MDEMDLDAEKNEMPYNDYGKLLRRSIRIGARPPWSAMESYGHA